MRAAAVLAVAVLAASCTDSADKAVDSVTVDGERVSAESLVAAHGSLCLAASRPDIARAVFFDFAHEALHTVARAVEDVDRTQAAELLQAKEKVESELDARPPTLPADLSRLAGFYRASLGRLAIEAPPCDK